MCVGISARVEEIADGFALVDVTGAKRKVNVEMITNLKIGDYVMLHAGIAIARITENEAKETEMIMNELYSVVD